MVEGGIDNIREKGVGEEEFSSTLRSSSSWAKNQIDIKQVNRRKKAPKLNFKHMGNP